jgi:cytochrome c553
MHAAFDAVDKVHEALEKGDLPEAVKEGQALRASVETQEIPASWEPHLQRFDAAAAALIEADDPAEASARAAELVAACGGCHAALQATVVLPEPEEPAGPDAPMQLHAWAVKRMWEGLVMPSEDRFLRGTATLALLPTCERDPERCQRFRQVVQRSHVAQTDEQRVELYGRLLATCSDCHRATAGGP